MPERKLYQFNTHIGTACAKQMRTSTGVLAMVGAKRRWLAEANSRAGL
jgi:hypothetical protein